MADNKGTFSDFEREAIKNRAKELRAEQKADKDRNAGEKMIQDAIKAMVEPDKVLAKKIDELVKSTAPDLMPKTWYGMPAYARDGKVMFFFQSGKKFGARYGTLGFTDQCKLDEGNMWPNSYAITKITPAEEKEIVKLIKKAVGK